MIRPVRAASFLLLAPSLCAQAVPAIDAARVAALLEQLTPEANAPWRSVSWQLDLLAAQRTAAAQRKPLFVWAMDGHPLGCT